MGELVLNKVKEKNKKKLLFVIIIHYSSTPSFHHSMWIAENHTH